MTHTIEYQSHDGRWLNQDIEGCTTIEEAEAKLYRLTGIRGEGFELVERHEITPEQFAEAIRSK